MTLVLLWMAAQDGVYESREHRLRLEVPTDRPWKIRTKNFEWKREGTVCEFTYDDGWVGGLLVGFSSGMSVDEYADWREKSWKDGNPICRREAERRWEGRRDGKWLSREFLIDTQEGNRSRYVVVFVQREGWNYELLLWCIEATWEKYKRTMRGIADRFESTTAAPISDPPKRGARYSDPRYGFALTLPAKWSTRAAGSASARNVVLEFLRNGRSVGSVQREEKAATIAAWADWMEKTAASERDGYRLVSRGPWGRGERLEYRYQENRKESHAVFLFVADGRTGTLYILSVLLPVAEWAVRREEVDGMLGDFVPLAREWLIPNPWEGCKPGSRARYRSISEAGVVRMSHEYSHQLLDQDVESYTYKKLWVMSGDQLVEDPATRVWFADCRKIRGGKEDPRLWIDEGEETVRVPAGEFKCRRIRSTDARWETRTWTCAQVPGHVVRKVIEYGGVRYIDYLVSFEKK